MLKKEKVSTQSFTKDRRSCLQPFSTKEKKPFNPSLKGVGKGLGKGLRNVGEGVAVTTFFGAIGINKAFKGVTGAIKGTGSLINKVSLNFFSGVKEGVSEESSEESSVEFLNTKGI